MLKSNCVSFLFLIDGLIHCNLILNCSSSFQKEQMHDLVGNCSFVLDFRMESQSGTFSSCFATSEKEYLDISHRLPPKDHNSPRTSSLRPPENSLWTPWMIIKRDTKPRKREAYVAQPPFIPLWTITSHPRELASRLISAEPRGCHEPVRNPCDSTTLPIFPDVVIFFP